MLRAGPSPEKRRKKKIRFFKKDAYGRQVETRVDDRDLLERRMSKTERYMRQFKPLRALSCALSTVRSKICSELCLVSLHLQEFYTRRRPELLIALLKEIHIRKALHRVIAGLLDEQMLNLLKFTRRHLTVPEFVPVLVAMLRTVNGLLTHLISCKDRLV